VHGLSVALPVAGRNGYIDRIECPDGPRHAVLFDYAAGEKPQPPLGPELYFAFGRAVAQFHELSNGFLSEHHRAGLDSDVLIDAPLAQALPLLQDSADRTCLAEIATALCAKIADFAAHGVEWGPIHGDATFDNLHVTESGEVILFDFDSGGPGWRASDLQGWAANDPAFRYRWDAFHEGYGSVRTIDPLNLSAAPFLTIAWDLWGLKVDLDNRVIRLGAEATRAYLEEQIARIRARCVRCGLI
jgi:Ser/Thr protein kinase RdoA (MazF antagonist)